MRHGFSIIFHFSSACMAVRHAQGQPPANSPADRPQPPGPRRAGALRGRARLPERRRAAGRPVLAAGQRARRRRARAAPAGAACGRVCAVRGAPARVAVRRRRAVRRVWRGARRARRQLLPGRHARQRAGAVFDSQQGAERSGLSCLASMYYEAVPPCARTALASVPADSATWRECLSLGAPCPHSRRCTLQTIGADRWRHRTLAEGVLCAATSPHARSAHRERRVLQRP